VGRNGSTIEGIASDLICNISNVAVQLVFSGTTWTVFAQAGGAGGVIDINSQTTGTLGVARGGTGATSLTANAVLIGNGTSAVSAVAPGTAGNVLASNGMAWTSVAPAGGGAWTFLSSVSASNSSIVEFDGVFSLTYDLYAVTCSNLFVGTSGASLFTQFKISGAYRTSSYSMHLHSSAQGSTAYAAIAPASFPAQITVLSDMGNDVWDNAGFVMYFYGPANTSTTKVRPISWTGINTKNGTAGAQMAFGVGTYTGGTVGPIEAVKFYMSAGNINSGTFRVYGIKNS
jgi:hypothetical protein